MDSRIVSYPGARHQQMMPGPSLRFSGRLGDNWGDEGNEEEEIRPSERRRREPTPRQDEDRADLGYSSEEPDRPSRGGRHRYQTTPSEGYETLTEEILDKSPKIEHRIDTLKGIFTAPFSKGTAVGLAAKIALTLMTFGLTSSMGLALYSATVSSAPGGVSNKSIPTSEQSPVSIVVQRVNDDGIAVETLTLEPSVLNSINGGPMGIGVLTDAEAELLAGDDSKGIEGSHNFRQDRSCELQQETEGLKGTPPYRKNERYLVSATLVPTELVNQWREEEFNQRVQEVTGSSQQGILSFDDLVGAYDKIDPGQADKFKSLFAQPVKNRLINEKPTYEQLELIIIQKATANDSKHPVNVFVIGPKDKLPIGRYSFVPDSWGKNFDCSPTLKFVKNRAGDAKDIVVDTGEAITNLPGDAVDVITDNVPGVPLPDIPKPDIPGVDVPGIG